MNTDGGALHFDAVVNNIDFNKAMADMERRILGMSNNIQRGGSEIDDFFKNAGAAVAGYLSVQAFSDFTNKILEVSSEFQKFDAVLTNTLGSEALADSAMNQLQEFASKTPFSVRELTDAFVKLANQGFIPSGRQMRQLGDLASSTGKQFDQLAEAILDAQNGEYERLKEFGIKAKDAGDKVIFTFKGVATEVDKTSSSIRNYITGLGDAEGVSGSMAAISETLGGKISNLEDNWDALLKTIGEGTDGVFSTAISALSQMLEAATQYVELLNTASKYNLTTSTSSVIDKVGTTGILSGVLGLLNLGDNQSQAGFIQDLSRGLSESNNKFLEGAKYIREYNARYKELEIERINSLRGITDIDIKNAINAEYQAAKNIIRDSAVQVLKDRNKPKDANFGSGGKSDEEKRLERISNAYKKLDSDLSYIGLDKKLSLEEVDNKKISAYESLIKSLIDNGIKPTDKAITDLIDKIFNLNNELNSIEGKEFAGNLSFKQIQADAKEATNFQEKAIEAIKKFRDNVAEMEATVDPKVNALSNPPALKENKTQENLSKVSEAAYQVSDAFYSWSDALSGVNDDLSYTLGQIGDMAGLAGNLAADLASGNPVQQATGVLKAAAGLFSMGKKVKQMNEAARAEQKKFYDEAIKGERDYQALLRQRERDTTRRGKNSYNAIVSELELIKSQTPEIEKLYNQLYGSLQGQSYIDDVGYKHGTWFRKAKTWDIMASLAGSDYDELEKLYSQGKLKDQAKADFEALKKLREELTAAGIDVETLTDQLNEMLTGTSVSGLSDSLIALFENGKLGAEDFGQSFEEIMKKSISNSFKYKVLEDAMSPFYESLADTMKAGTPTQSQIDALREQYIKAGQDAADRFKNLEQVTGISLTDGPRSLNEPGLTGAIKRELTEQTASELTGLYRASYDLAKRQYDLLDQEGITMREQLDFMNRQIMILTGIEQNTGRTADNTERLQAIELSLDTIVKNTKPSQTARDLGL